ncbi:MAG: patatin-like phospholipase family protein [Bacteroidetes bacterium]|nr:patatin-like phospholipase family protein [Bacteroidota bacterium]MCL2303389.1 patatin-like phospholipase family protein [Lentimicrobiaceae bacterium]
MKRVIIFLFLIGTLNVVFGQKQVEKVEYGIVLSGGGALGFAHIGALQALEEAGIELPVISGASMGALIGAMYAHGYSPKEISDIIEREKVYKKSKIFNFHLFRKKGISDHRKLSKVLDNIFKTNHFDSLQRFFALSMTDFVNLETEYAFSGDHLKTKLMASSSIPAFFEVIELDGKIYVDGGVMNNLPIEPIKDKCNKIIMIDVSAVYPQTVNSGKIKIANRAVAAMFQQMNADRIAQADHYIRFEELAPYHMFDFKEYKEIIRIGYEGTKKYLQEHPELR